MAEFEATAPKELVSSLTTEDVGTLEEHVKQIRKSIVTLSDALITVSELVDDLPRKSEMSVCGDLHLRFFFFG